MNQELHRAQWWAGIYPLAIAMLVGLGWMDSSWYHGLQGRVPELALNGAARGVGDMLLWLLALVLFTGGVAAWLWDGVARLLCIASIGVLCLEFVMPALIRALPGGSFYLDDVGLFLRSCIHLVALALAVLAFRRSLT